MPQTLRSVRMQLDAGETSASALTQAAIARILDPQGEGARAFIGGPSRSASAQAIGADSLAAVGRAGPLSGIPIAIKDLFDVQGEVTRAGSRVLNAPPARGDSAVAARLTSAGAVLVGRTNMSEFAYTGVGINPHFGTPLNPWDRATGRIPGGSSSGAAVAVADGMCVAAIGTDTGGSCRIPAALCGLVGFKPSPGTIPGEGVVPLSPSLDTVGSLAHSVACCAALDQVMQGKPITPLSSVNLRGLRIAIPTNHMMEEMDAPVAKAFGEAITRLKGDGALIFETHFTAFELLPGMTANGGIVAAEAYAWHREKLAEHGALYDPRIRQRIEAGAQISAADYLALLERRASLSALFDAESAPFDVLAMPTVPIIAPAIESLANPDEYYRINRLLLRNTSVANMFGACAISLPIHPANSAPVGLMLMGRTGTDRRLLAIANAIFPS